MTGVKKERRPNSKSSTDVDAVADANNNHHIPVRNYTLVIDVVMGISANGLDAGSSNTTQRNFGSLPSVSESTRASNSSFIVSPKSLIISSTSSTLASTSRASRETIVTERITN